MTAMTRGEKLAYQRGYNRGCRWPEHRPPTPPDKLMSAVIEAARKLRDAVDGELATLGEDDEWQETLGGPMDEFDHAMTKLSYWLLGKTDDSNSDDACDYYWIGCYR